MALNAAMMATNCSRLRWLVLHIRWGNFLLLILLESENKLLRAA